MKTRLIFVALTFAATAFGLDTNSTDHPTPIKTFGIEQKKDFFSKGDLQIDAITGAVSPGLDLGKSTWAAGLGVNYFPTEQIGGGIRAMFDDVAHEQTGSFVDEVSGRVIGRLTSSGSRWCPYGGFEGGYIFDQDAGFAGAFVGLRYAFTRQFSLGAELGARLLTPTGTGTEGTANGEFLGLITAGYTF